ncbi:MAG: 2-phospho-L-lactate guanylyltransferase [Xanthobacteraceae bacterium]|nr:2-phospho-L-lactate guanylyltransferase [Xanthobacteraceae bacterium]
MDRLGAVDARNVWAVVPVKAFSHAKRRLAPVLSEAERAALVRTMLVDVLTALHATSRLAGILVVTSDPQAARTAALCDAQVVDDNEADGLNGAVRRGLDILDASKAGALVVPADIPFATASDYSAVLDLLTHYPVVLAPASSDGGTNALALRQAGSLKPCFGEDSFNVHRAQAARAGLAVGIARSEGLGHDIDRIDDILAARKLRRKLKTASSTSALFGEIDLIRRVGLDALPVAARYM